MANKRLLHSGRTRRWHAKFDRFLRNVFNRPSGSIDQVQPIYVGFGRFASNH